MKKGQVAIVNVMIGLIAVIALVVSIEPIKDQIRSARSDLDCTNTSISTEEEMTCVVVSFTLPAWVGIGLAVALGALGGLIAWKRNRSQEQ